MSQICGIVFGAVIVLVFGIVFQVLSPHYYELERYLDILQEFLIPGV